MEIKMIVTDLDGTLLRDDKTISPRTVSVFKKCLDKKIKITFATGRNADSIVDGFICQIPFDGKIYTNGGTAYAGDELVYSRLFHISQAREMLLIADTAGVEIVVQRGGFNYSNHDFRLKWPWVKGYIPTDFKDLDVEIEKIYADVERPEALALIQKHLPDDLYISVARDNVAMIMHKEATKSKAVAALARYWGIPAENIVAFGDDLNDIDMLQYCGLGVVMESGLDEAKAVADEICDSNENDGMARWLEERIALSDTFLYNAD